MNERSRRLWAGTEADAALGSGLSRSSIPRCGRRSKSDAGGSNGYRSHVWKQQLQRVADKLNLAIRVSHFPPGTSKLKIERDDFHGYWNYLIKPRADRR
jgi:hypothetical protein